jgi:hypothetical protein
MGLLSRPIGDGQPMQRQFGDDNHSGAAGNAAPISIDRFLKLLN